MFIEDTKGGFTWEDLKSLVKEWNEHLLEEQGKENGNSNTDNHVENGNSHNRYWSDCSHPIRCMAYTN